jgi:hypothetical protein
MKTIAIILIFMGSAFMLNGQGRPGGPGGPGNPGTCEEYPARIESQIYYDWDAVNLQWVPNNTWTYDYEGEQNIRITFFNSGTGAILRKWEYYYDASGNRNYEIHTRPVGEDWINVSKRESEFNELNQRTSMTYSLWKNNAWALSTYNLYEYSEGKTTRQIVQVPDAQGQLEDNLYYLNYFQGDLLQETHTQRASDGIVTGKNVYSYNASNQLLENLVLEYKVEPDGSITYVPKTRRIYYYDEYNLLREFEYESWDGTQWNVYAKYVYQRRIDNANRVRVCDEGQSICIAKARVPDYLSRGATLGACPQTTLSTTRTQTTGEESGTLKVSETTKIYPNPATDFIQVSAGESFSRVDLLNKNGQTIRSFSLYNTDNTTIERNGLPSGIYFLRFVGQEEVKTEKVIFR